MVVLAGIISIWLYWDLSQAEYQTRTKYKSFKMLKSFDSVKSDPTKVAIVQSDDETLNHPIPVDDAGIDYPEIEDMVRRAIDLAGGLDGIVHSGDMVLLKPNIVDPEPPGSGEVTDVRVIKALIRIIDELAPGNIEIVVGEGSPRPMDYEMKYQSKFSSPCWTELWDAAGYQDLLTDTDLASVNFRLSNLNGSPPDNPWQDLVEVEVPGGGEADPQGGTYFIHKDVLNADVYITVPVMKIHDTGITVALKNQIGLAPSTMYGFSKTAGVSQDGYQHSLIHTSQLPKYWTHKEIVDLSILANIKFTVVDAIMCLDMQKTRTSYNQVRMNTIVAGSDPVAVDHVCARLMCLNPDDIEHITLAEKRGLGTNNPDLIQLEGDLDKAKRLFRKNQTSTADFGQSNRIWLVRGPYDIDGISDPIQHEFIQDEGNLRAEAEKEGWSEPVYFRDDHIDLKDYFQMQTGDKAISYLFAYFNAPENQNAELWIGSDEALKIYINGNEVYCYNATRSFPGDRFVSEKVTVPVLAGENSLLVKTLQQYGRYDFCLNICEPEENPLYDGNRIWGLKFSTETQETEVNRNKNCVMSDFKIDNAYPNPFNGFVTISCEVIRAGNLQIVIYNLRGETVKILFDGNSRTIGQKSFIWDGTDDRGRKMPSGSYVVSYRMDRFQTSRKLLYIQ